MGRQAQPLQAFTSTPVCSSVARPLTPVSDADTGIDENTDSKSRIDFRTPVINRSMIQQLQPRTPTPFKNHLASLEKKSGVVKLEVRPVSCTHSSVLTLPFCRDVFCLLYTCQTVIFFMYRSASPLFFLFILTKLSTQIFSH